MNIWKGIQNAIRYIEYNLTEELDIADIAAKANFSGYFPCCAALRWGSISAAAGSVWKAPTVRYRSSGRSICRTEALSSVTPGRKSPRDTRQGIPGREHKDMERMAPQLHRVQAGRQLRH